MKNVTEKGIAVLCRGCAQNEAGRFLLSGWDPDSQMDQPCSLCGRKDGEHGEFDDDLVQTYLHRILKSLRRGFRATDSPECRAAHTQAIQSIEFSIQTQVASGQRP